MAPISDNYPSSNVCISITLGLPPYRVKFKSNMTKWKQILAEESPYQKQTNLCRI